MEQNAFDLFTLTVCMVAVMSLPIVIGIVAVLRER